MEHREKFESEYRNGGTWSELFSRSKDYMSSFLFKSIDKVDLNLLIDTWLNRQTDEDIKREYETAYSQLSTAFEYLYLEENEVSEFHSLE